jgi:hypothetical protein
LAAVARRRDRRRRGATAGVRRQDAADLRLWLTRHGLESILDRNRIIGYGFGFA